MKIYDSGLMTATTPGRFISLDITGVKKLELVVTDGNGDVSADHANWCDAMLVSVDSSAAIERGDVNDDGTANIADLVQMKQMVLGKDYTERQSLAADVNRDGAINIFDLVELKLAILNGTV